MEFGLGELQRNKGGKKKKGEVFYGQEPPNLLKQNVESIINHLQ